MRRTIRGGYCKCRKGNAHGKEVGLHHVQFVDVDVVQKGSVWGLEILCGP